MCKGSKNCDCTECIFQINVIKAETKLALEMVEMISDEEEKFKWLNEIKDLILKEPSEEIIEKNLISSPPFKGYDFAKILKQAKITYKNLI